MALEFPLPDPGEGISEAEIVEWHVEPGDRVSEDDLLLEVETDKAVVEVPAPTDGTVTECRGAVGDVVDVGDVIVVIESDDSAEPTDSAESAAEDPVAPTTDEPTSVVERTDQATESGDQATAPDNTVDATPDDGADAIGPGRTVATPSTRRLAREEGVDIDAIDGSGSGGRVTEGDVRAAAAASAVADEADDASDAGPVGADAKPAETETAGRAETRDRGSDSAHVEPTIQAAADRDRTLAAPATRRVARELGVDLDAVPADEQHDGEALVTPDAVRAFAEARRSAGDQTEASGSAAAPAVSDATATSEAASSSDTATTPGAGSSPDAPADGETRVPYEGIRRTIGEQMTHAAFTAPHVTHHDSVDVTRLASVRDRLREHASDLDAPLTSLPFVLKAVVAALEDNPVLNSRLDEEAGEIVYLSDYDVGVATATDDGLMVPVVEAVDEKSVPELAAETADLAAKARDRSIAFEELQGGTFTVSNFGAIGGEYGTPIVDYPQTAILGLGRIAERPRVVDGEVVPRTVLPLSLSFDHRVVDGADAARFTNRVGELVSEPTLLLLE